MSSLQSPCACVLVQANLGRTQARIFGHQLSMASQLRSVAADTEKLQASMEGLRQESLSQGQMLEVIGCMLARIVNNPQLLQGFQARKHQLLQMPGVDAIAAQHFPQVLIPACWPGLGAPNVNTTCRSASCPACMLARLLPVCHPSGLCLQQHAPDLCAPLCMQLAEEGARPSAGEQGLEGPDMVD